MSYGKQNQIPQQNNLLNLSIDLLRYKKFLLWLGVPQHRIAESRPNEICRIISEFALEFRTTRERVLQQMEKKANHRERNKTRGKMITDVGKFKTKEDRADDELK